MACRPRARSSSFSAAVPCVRYSLNSSGSKDLPRLERQEYAPEVVGPQSGSRWRCGRGAPPEVALSLESAGIVDGLKIRSLKKPALGVAADALLGDAVGFLVGATGHMLHLCPRIKLSILPLPRGTLHVLVLRLIYFVGEVDEEVRSRLIWGDATWKPPQP